MSTFPYILFQIHHFKYRPTKKGKSKAEVLEDDDNATHISDDWDEEELELALKQSRYGKVKFSNVNSTTCTFHQQGPR
jgi:hypothetical protein